MVMLNDHNVRMIIDGPMREARIDLTSDDGLDRNQAAMLRSLAFQTRYPESRVRLLALADNFDKLAERVEAREFAVANVA